MAQGKEIPPPDLILADSAWLHRFTRKLVHDADLAEDLGQETLLASLAEPESPRSGHSRSWLAAVARNIAISIARRTTRRRQAERSAARHGTARETADVVADLELQGAAVQALLSLHEPYQATLIWRFMKGLSCREIATRSQEPIETVRARVKRGLALLRAKLDQQHGGRRGWLAPIGIPALWNQSALSLWGIVLMQAKTKPVAGAWVRVGGKGTRVKRRDLPDGGAIHAPPAANVLTDKLGTFKVTSLQPGTIPVKVFAEGFGRWRRELDCQPRSLSHVYVELRAGAALFGQVLAGNGEPVPDASVMLALEVPQNSTRQVDAEGRYSFADLPTGEWSMQVFSPKLGSMESRVVLASGQEREMDLTFAAELQIRGVLTDHLGAPLGRWIVHEKAGKRDFAVTDEQGKFVLNNCENRMHTLRVFPPRFNGPAVLTLDPVLPSQEMRTVKVPLAALPSARIVGRVLMPDGTAGTGVHLSLQHNEWPSEAPRAPDAAGRFDVGPLPPGTYRLLASVPGYLPADFGEITLVANEVRQLAYTRLRDGAELSLRIASSEPAKMRGLEVVVLDAADHAIQRGSVNGTVVSFDLLPPGSHKLSVRGPGIEPQLVPIQLKARETLELTVHLR